MSIVLNDLFKRSRLFYKVNSLVSQRECSSSSKAGERLELDDVDVELKELQIEKLRDKSRLKPEHKNILFSKKPYFSPIRTHHITVKYNRKLYGKYGNESGVSPGIMWPNKDDLQDIKDYEKVAYPLSLQEMVVAAKKDVDAKEEHIQQMQANVVEKLKKLQTWKNELRSKLAKKEAEALAAKEKKANMIEEVRRHFGFTVDPRDERFQQLLAEKQKEQSKKDKQARLEDKERKAIERLMSKHEANREEQKELGN